MSHTGSMQRNRKVHACLSGTANKMQKVSKLVNQELFVLYHNSHSICSVESAHMQTWAMQHLGFSFGCHVRFLSSSVWAVNWGVTCKKPQSAAANYTLSGVLEYAMGKTAPGYSLLVYH